MKRWCEYTIHQNARYWLVLFVVFGGGGWGYMSVSVKVNYWWLQLLRHDARWLRSRLCDGRWCDENQQRITLNENYTLWKYHNHIIRYGGKGAVACFAFYVMVFYRTLDRYLKKKTKLELIMHVLVGSIAYDKQLKKNITCVVFVFCCDCKLLSISLLTYKR